MPRAAIWGTLVKWECFFPERGSVRRGSVVACSGVPVCCGGVLRVGSGWFGRGDRVMDRMGQVIVFPGLLCPFGDVGCPVQGPVCGACRLDDQRVIDDHVRSCDVVGFCFICDFR